MHKIRQNAAFGLAAVMISATAGIAMAVKIILLAGQFHRKMEL